jgi:hypothetical protein
MNIVLIGATGAIGSRILDEALRRGHKVTAVTRDPKKVEARQGMTVAAGSTTDGPALTRLIKGHDVAVVSVKWNENDVRRVIDTDPPVGREALPVRGRRRQPAAQGRPHALRAHGREGHPAADLETGGARLRGDQEDQRPRLDGDLAPRLDPARRAHRQVSPWPRSAVENDKGESRISREDFAIAILDELEKPKHVKKRFTAAY